MISTYCNNYNIRVVNITTSTNNRTISYFKFTKKLKL